jgi:hypothetical protein
MLRLLPWLFVLVVVQVLPASAQDNPCDPKAWLPATDPAYAEAINFRKRSIGMASKYVAYCFRKKRKCLRGS